MKKPILLLTALMAVSLSGCSAVTDYLSDRMMEQSGIYDDADYQEYRRYADAGQINDAGYYSDAAEEAAEEEHGSIRVTFSENNNLNVRYFSDDAHQNIFTGTGCYLNPGDSIYAEVSLDDAVFSSMYRFSEFRIYEYTSDGKRTPSAGLEMKEADSGTGYVLTIPDGFTGTNISIEPVGTYEMRSIVLRDYYVDDNDQEHELNGTWTVNDKDYASDTAEISPVASYIISYQYDSDEYFYLSSSPACFYISNVEGLLIFNQREADDETVDYSVALHRYMSVTLVSDRARTVSINGESAQAVQANEEVVIGHLKYGDAVAIETDKPWSNLERSRELILTDTQELSDSEYKYRYTLIVPEKGGEFTFDPTAYSYEHGEITFRCFGQKAETTQILAKGSRIYYEQASADNGWWLAGDASEHYIIVGGEAETQAALNAIHFTEMLPVTVNLPQPSAGGAVKYMLNGTEITGSSVSAYSGDKITFKFEPWEGWITSVQGEKTYDVNDDRTQTVTFDGQEIDAVLTEDSGHMPELSLKLEKSVGQSMRFTLTASGFYMDAESYGGGNILNNTETLVSGQKIGTDQPIQLTMTGRALQSGTAVRMVITLTDTDGKKTKDIRYTDNLSNTVNPIYVYEPGTNAEAAAWYKSIEISIGVVDIEKFTAPTALEHSGITVTAMDTSAGRILQNGDLIEADTKVIVKISPERGYYVTGKKVTGDSYTDTMKYSDYQKNIGKIIAEHPVEKYITIILDKSDSYAVYTYKLDGEAVTGAIYYAREGQKLELTYEITDGKHHLTEASGGFLGIIGASDTKVTKTITIDSKMDGAVITKTDFGIETK